MPHAKAHRVMLCPDGPDTGFVDSSYRHLRMILNKRKFYKGVIVPEASPRKVSLNSGALFYRTCDFKLSLFMSLLKQNGHFLKVNGLVV